MARSKSIPAGERDGADSATLARWRRGAACMVASAFFFSLMTLFVKLATETLPSIEVVLARSLITAGVSLAMLRRLRISPWGRRRGTLLLRGIFGFGGLTCFYLAVDRLDLADATVIHYTNPIFVALLAALLLGERFGLRHGVCVLAALAGVVLIARPPLIFGGGGGLDPVGVAAGLTGALFSAGAYVTVRRLGEGEHPLVVVLYLPLVSFPLALPLALPVARWPEGIEWVWLVGVGVTTQIAQVFMTRGLQLLPAGRATALGYTQVVFASALGWICFGTALSVVGVGGALLVIGSAAMLTRSR